MARIVVNRSDGMRVEKQPLKTKSGHRPTRVTYSKLPSAAASCGVQEQGRCSLRPDRPAKASGRRVGPWPRRRDQVVAARGHQPGLDECPGFEGRRVTVGQVDHRIDIQGLPFESSCSTISCSDDGPSMMTAASLPIRVRCARATDLFLTSHQRMSPPLLLGGRHVVVEAERPRALLVRVSEDPEVVEAGVADEALQLGKICPRLAREPDDQCRRALRPVWARLRDGVSRRSAGCLGASCV